MIEVSWATEYGLKGRTAGEIMLPACKRTRKKMEGLLYHGREIAQGLVLSSTSGGTGKTAFTKALAANERYEVKEIDGTGLGKDDIEPLKQSLFLQPFAEKWLVVINETSSATKPFLFGQRELIDSCGRLAYFVYTDNFGANLIKDFPQVFNNSRVEPVDFSNPDKEMYANVLRTILKEKGGAAHIADYAVEACYPDLRSAINMIEDIVLYGEDSAGLTVLKTKEEEQAELPMHYIIHAPEDKKFADENGALYDKEKGHRYVNTDDFANHPLFKFDLMNYIKVNENKCSGQLQRRIRLTDPFKRVDLDGNWVAYVPIVGNEDLCEELILNRTGFGPL